MTRRDLLPGTVRPVNVAAPGNAHLILCECGHGPDNHEPQAGCIALVPIEDHWTGIQTGSLGEDFCPCTAYEVAP